MRRPTISTFFKHNAIFWSASLFVSFLNYLYYPVLGRLLPPTSFGETQTIISIFTQTAAFFQVLGLVSIGIITKYSDEKERELLNNELSRLALLIAVFFFALTVICSPLLKTFFQFEDIGPFVLLGFILLVNVPLAFANAFLQGNQKFSKLSRVNILNASTKLLLSVCFVVAGLKTIGAVGGLICSQIVALVYSLSIGSGIKQFVKVHMRNSRLDLKKLKPELPYAGMVLITSLTTNLFISFDILVIKHYFSPEQAGLYTGISIISNIILYITGPFAMVMIPSIKPSQSNDENFAILRKSMLIALAIGGSLLLVFLLVPRLITLVLLGHDYTPYANYLRGLSVSMFAISVANLLIYYHIGLRHFLVAPAVLIGLITTLVLLASEHATLGMVIRDLVIGSCLLLVLQVALVFYYRKEPA